MVALVDFFILRNPNLAAFTDLTPFLPFASAEYLRMTGPTYEPLDERIERLIPFVSLAETFESVTRPPADAAKYDFPDVAVARSLNPDGSWALIVTFDAAAEAGAWMIKELPRAAARMAASANVNRRRTVRMVFSGDVCPWARIEYRSP
jgi:hypothetical protein